jgi:uncharacterized protein YjbJ (UPF0337 family)
MEATMNWDQIEGKWKQSVGQVKEKWGKLTDDDLTVIAGKRDQLVGKVQERYGIMREEAERQVNEFERSYHDAVVTAPEGEVEEVHTERRVRPTSKARTRGAGKP